MNDKVFVIAFVNFLQVLLDLFLTDPPPPGGKNPGGGESLILYSNTQP